MGRPSRILIAPNAFKGSLTALEAARAMARGVKDALPGAQTVLLPIADGGDGLMEALLWERGGRRIRIAITGPMGERRQAEYAVLPGGEAAIEMARASGLILVKGRRDPMGSTSYGTGELILHALTRGCRRIYVGLGGTASSDGGAGMAQALGFRLLDARGRDIMLGAAGLLSLYRVQPPARLPSARVFGVSDVRNPLLGPRGSARVFSPQKGADARQVRLIGKALERWARIMRRDLGADVARRPGAGAAGGLGAGLAACLGAELVPGAAFVLKYLGVDKLMRGAAAVLTGEGRWDNTSSYGKAPWELARLAQAHDVPAALVCGVIDGPTGFRAAVSFADVGAAGKNSVSQAGHWAQKAAARAVQRLLLASALLATLFPGLRAETAVSSTTLKSIDRLYFHRHQEDNLERSISKCEELLEAEPDHPELTWRLGRSLARLGERQEKKKDKLKAYERADKTLEKAVKLKPEDPEVHFWRGIVMGRVGQTRGIFKSLFLVGPMKKEMETVIKLDPRHSGAHHVLGEMLRQIPGFAGGSKKKAVRELETALELDPTYTAHYPALAEAYIDIGEKGKAVETLKKIFDVKQPMDPGEYDDNIKDSREMLKKLKVEA